MDDYIFNFILFIFIIIIAHKIYITSDTFNLRCIISDINGNTYCVRDRTKLKLAANKLANLNIKLNKLVKHLGETYR